jgi:hypothetical protein
MFFGEATQARRFEGSGVLYQRNVLSGSTGVDNGLELVEEGLMG